MNRRTRPFVTGLVAIVAVPALVFGSAPAWAADPISPPTLPDAVVDEGYATPPRTGLSDELLRATGTVEVTVRLAEPAVGDTLPEGALTEGAVPSEAEQQAQTEKVVEQQDVFLNGADALGATEIGRTELAANVVAVSVDAEQLEALASLENVVSVTPVRIYETNGTTPSPAPSAEESAPAEEPTPPAESTTPPAEEAEPAPPADEVAPSAPVEETAPPGPPTRSNPAASRRRSITSRLANCTTPGSTARVSASPCSIPASTSPTSTSADRATRRSATPVWPVRPSP